MFWLGWRKAGFVLHEILIVNFILALLLALLLPAVQQAREAARRSTCKNNLKQMGLALHNYHDSYNCFPPGCVNVVPGVDGDPQAVTYQGNWGWGASVLPYLDMRLYREFDYRSMPANLDASGTPTGVGLQVFQCPSDGGPAINVSRPFAGLNGEPQYALALSNYVGVNGSGELQHVSNGTFYVNSSVRFGDFIDGPSNTLMVGERCWSLPGKGWGSLPQDHRAGVVYGTRGIREASQHGLADNQGCGKYALNSRFNDDAPGGGHSKIRRGFSSSHSGGVQFLFADGSVRFISETIDADIGPGSISTRTDAVDSTLERLMSRNDGQPISDF